MNLKKDFPTKEELAVLRVACENSLKAYIKVIHYYTTGTKFILKDFHNEVIEALQERAFYKNTKNLILNIPVGFGKSIIVQYFISWCFARNKNQCFLYTSYSDSLITKHSGEIKDIVESNPYNTLWGYILRKDKKSKSNWSITGGTGRSGLTAGSVGGTITGLDAGNPVIKGFCGAMVIDDPMKAGDEIFESKRDMCKEHFTRKLTTRLRRSDVPIILIMQRLHEEDLSGYIKNEGKYQEDLTKEEKEDWKNNWDCITVKALVDEKSIWEEKVSTTTLIKERVKSPFVFYPQRQQDPNSNINTSFKGIKYATDEEENLIFDGICHIDKGFDGADGTAFCVIKKVGEGFFVFGKLWDKHIDDCMADIEVYREQYRGGTIYTENNDDKGALGKNYIGITDYHESQNKHFKIMTHLYPAWKNIKFLKGTDSNYIRQIQHFNEKSKHDDAPDNLASAIRQLTEPTSFDCV